MAANEQQDTPLGFIGYVTERHTVNQRRAAGEAQPWSTDPIIATRRLCSVVRDEDRTSVEARKVVLAGHDPELLALVFRWVNKAETLAALDHAGLSRDWSWKRIRAVLVELDKPLNYQAYKINPPGKLWNLEGISKRMVQLVEGGARRWPEAVTTMRQLVGITNAPFISYQTLQDLRWLYGRYTDEEGWVYVGPGAMRGFMRLRGTYEAAGHWRDRDKVSVSGKAVDKDFRYKDPVLWEALPGLLVQMRVALGEPELPLFEVEHNLCEWDKYMRFFTGEAKATGPRGLFRPRPNWPLEGGRMALPRERHSRLYEPEALGVAPHTGAWSKHSSAGGQHA